MDQPSSTPSPFCRWGFCAIVAFLVVGFTSLIVWRSMIDGRLSTIVAYDDVVYMSDGLSRLQQFENEGPKSVYRWYVGAPPHSPYSSFLAAASFKIFGRHDWAPYAGNGLVILLLLTFVDAALAGAGRMTRCLALLFALSTPVAGFCVHEFRPDLCCGLLSAFGLFLAASAPATRTWRTPTAIGACVGFALLAKPSVFAMTLLFFVGSMFLYGVRRRCWDGGQFGLKALFMDVLTMTAVVGLLFGPHFLLAREHLIHYFVQNIFGEHKKFWVYDGTFRDHLFYFSTGHGGAMMLGKHLRWLLALTVVGSLASFRPSAPRGARSLATLLLLALAASYVLPTLNDVKQQFFGAVFYFTLIFSAMAIPWAARVDLLVGSAIEAIAQRARVRLSPPAGGAPARTVGWEWALAAVVTLVGFREARWPTFTKLEGDRAFAVRQVYEQIADAAATLGLRPGQNIGCNGIGWMNCDALAYGLRMHGCVGVAGQGLGLEPTVDRAAGYYDFVDAVLATENDNGIDDSQFPVAKSQDEFLALLRARRDFELVAIFPAFEGKKFYLFRKTATLPVSSASTESPPLR